MLLDNVRLGHGRMPFTGPRKVDVTLLAEGAMQSRTTPEQTATS